ncbi:MAG: isocitrate/isopropylmalate dehydrogenase family protein [Nitrososphaeria archaeon]|nr:isocitrate/isopropylmalate dehydrogenase family protein [Nitrosopumilaceae archaeon]NIP09701.1 isocitrate/isopropylmalate dehydrogenase family protein [Nitrosopumilaceae archaeon]NIP91248.1 isocitrate/isopropylmalate dehydrogenase family protein [Nitrososphaeria archaeon]NIS95760.1 isocitrate/isopropylmalate dehydrogenase family protein [Nitrosopumilaceae archaeon]
MSKKAAVMKGDGIGPEVVDSMLRVLKECNSQSEIILCEAGSEQWDKNGRKDKSYIPDDTMKILEESDACFKGPTTTIPVPNAPRSVAVTLRQKFELYSNIRPTKTYDRLTPDRKLDCVCFREATEGLYTGVEAKITDDAAIAIRKITRQGSRRFLNSSVDWAKKYDLKKMVAITKRNILKQTDGIFWDEAQKSIEGTDIELSEIYIDNMAQQLVVAPEQFNGAVLVSTNLFMDIISELASGLVGSIGLIYSANMGDDFAMFEAAHGSAPQFAGQNKVNPTATVLSGAWMAEYLGETDIRNAIFSATEQVINEGKYVTWDIGGNATTTQMTDAIIEYSKNNLRK